MTNQGTGGRVGIGGGIEITDAWLVLPPERDRKVVVTAARAMHRKAAEFATYADALRDLGLIIKGRAGDGIVSDVHLDEGAIHEEKLFRALAAGAGDDSMLVIWDTRGGARNVYRVDFDGAGQFQVEFLVYAGGEPDWAPEPRLQ
jgi:hypothetical protein